MKGEVQLEPTGTENPSDADPLLGNQADSPPESSSSTEIKDEEDIEAGSIPCCRICLESDAEPGELSLLIISDWVSFEFDQSLCLTWWASMILL